MFHFKAFFQSFISKLLFIFKFSFRVMQLVKLRLGGITEACVTALSLGMDTGFVAAHHLIRITSLILAAPAAHGLMSSALSEKKRR